MKERTYHIEFDGHKISATNDLEVARAWGFTGNEDLFKINLLHVWCFEKKDSVKYYAMFICSQEAFFDDINFSFVRAELNRMFQDVTKDKNWQPL